MTLRHGGLGDLPRKEDIPVGKPYHGPSQGLGAKESTNANLRKLHDWQRFRSWLVKGELLSRPQSHVVQTTVAEIGNLLGNRAFQWPLNSLKGVDIASYLFQRCQPRAGCRRRCY
jgi:hypothetical protein